MMKLADAFNIAGGGGPGLLARLDAPIFLVGSGAVSTWLTLFHMALEPVGAANVALCEIALDAVLAVASLLCALVSRRMGSLSRRPAVILLGCAVAGIGTLLAAAGCGRSPALFYVGAVLGMVGTVVCMLLWAEYYSCLSPARIALYASWSVLAGEFLRMVMVGFAFAHLALGMAVLPVLSATMLLRAYRSLPADELPCALPGPAPRIPWMPVAVLGAYSLCYGLVAKTSDSSIVVTTLSKLMPAAIVIASIKLQSDRFSFNDAYRLGIPLAIVGGALLCGFSEMDPTVANFFVAFGFFACRILVKVRLGTEARTAGTGAAYLFGVQIAVQYAASLVGKAFLLSQVQEVLPPGLHGVLTLGMCLLTAVLALMLLRGVDRLEPAWAARLGDAPDHEALRVERLQALAQRCGLSDRELEVALLLLKGRTFAQIGHELCIAEGTAKSHANRIYRKLGIAGRGELEEALG